MTSLPHLTASGDAHMVDVSEKPVSVRRAVAEGFIVMSREAFAALEAGSLKKGDALSSARIAGIMAAKKTADLVPLCHPLALTKVEVSCEPAPNLPGVMVRAEVGTTDRTGVEMEALTAVAVACLTVYDMAKAVDRAMRIDGIRLLEKSGGTSGEYHAP
ncbi:MAG: cyclic pyranopterin monophosphate synthase MoaC [Methylobacteriaceae bacterium]|jgi:cyclic pyranopterin phosphate synthase|nr:cyclic pyranopterin monophosphate synthase MoaC [Methylobacteriaceae bacterium]